MQQVQVTKWVNDAGVDFIKAENARQAFKNSVVDTCKKEHPVAKGLARKFGGAPYYDCIDDKMARYDEAIATQNREDRMNAAIEADAKATALKKEKESEMITPVSSNEVKGNQATSSSIIKSDNAGFYIAGAVAAIIALIIIFVGVRNRNQSVQGASGQ